MIAIATNVSYKNDVAECIKKNPCVRTKHCK